MSEIALEVLPKESVGFWADVREALKGSHQNYTEGPIGRAILILAIPMVLEMVMESVFAVVDVFFVGKLGANAVATVGLTESMLMILYALAMGLSIGATATIARRTGEKNPEGAANTAIQSLALGVGISFVVALVGVAFSRRFLTIMGASPEVIEHGVGYTRMMLGGNASILLLFLTNAIFRGAGDGALSMRALWLANGINIILCPCLIFGLGPFPAMGVTGAAIATTIGRGTGALYGLSKLFRGKGRVRVERRHFHLQPRIMLNLIRISSSAVFQVFVGTASWIGIMRVLSVFGSQAIAGYVIGIRVIIFALMPAFGMGNAAATMVGQSLGAGLPERAERAVWMAGFYNMCFLGSFGLIFVIFANSIVSIFTQDPAVALFAVSCLRMLSAGFLFYAWGMVLTQSFNGAGDTWTPTLLNLFVFWLFEIPLAYVLSIRLGLGPRGVFLAIPIAFSTLAFMSAVIFRRGRWKTRKV